jgi:sugar/nucleoside kinase (ribokinase family)
MDGNGKTVLGIGGAHVDRRGQASGDWVPGASNPGTMREDVGGGTFNAMRSIVQRGVAGAMLSVRGGDAAGEAVAAAIAAAGIQDLSVTFLDRRTPSYTALLDRHGDVVAALADMGLYEIAFGRQLRRASVREAIERADALFCDANLAADALLRLPALAGDRPMFAIAISPAKAVRLAGVLPHLSCLFLNLREARALVGQADADALRCAHELFALGLRRSVISQGDAPVIASDWGAVRSFRPPTARRIVDVTGAGDALAGATVAAILNGEPFFDAVREGIAAALLAVETADSVPRLPHADFTEALALVPAGRSVHQAAEQGDMHDA